MRVQGKKAINWCVAAAAVGALLGAADSARAAFPGGNGDIAFRSTCGFEQSVIGTIRTDGSEMRNLTACGDIWYGPKWSPDGGSILFAGPHQISQMSADGSGLRSVTAGTAPTYSPDGRHLTYVRGTAGREIWRARTDGSGARRIRAGTPFASRPQWSPQGRTIAYNQHGKGITLISARTGRLVRRLTSVEMLPLDWSPNGRWLLCARAASKRPEEPNYDLYLVRADGKGAPKRLMRTRHKSEFAAAWSPNGRRIVVLVRTHAQGLERVTMSTISRRGTDPRRIWRTPAYDPTDESLTVAIPLDVSWQPRATTAGP